MNAEDRRWLNSVVTPVLDTIPRHRLPTVRYFLVLLPEAKYERRNYKTIPQISLLGPLSRLAVNRRTLRCYWGIKQHF